MKFKMTMMAIFLTVTVFGGLFLLDNDTAVAAEARKTPEGAKIVVTYFHGNARCPTCMKLEAYSGEAVKQGFPEEITKGAVEFRTVNIDEGDNRHFVKDYQLVTRSVVVSKIESGKEVQWKNLDRIWTLVGDKEKFLAYIKAETKSLMDGNS